MKLLLVDDDRISIDILAEYIHPYLNHIDEVLCAYDGTEAMDIIQQVKPNILVTDVRMPNMTGIELVKRIQTIPDYDPVVLIISGYSDFNYAREALQLHVLDYLLKPVDQDELIEKINAIADEEVGNLPSDNDDIIEWVQSYIASHLDQHLKLIDIAEQVHYNAAYLGRRLKQKTGHTFNDYLLRLRVDKAQKLLRETNRTIKEISHDVGYKDPEHFSKQFKKVTNSTPTGYRETHSSK